MELRQLEYFREIASTGSINEAARHLNMSQPPLSYQIRQLENELNLLRKVNNYFYLFYFLSQNIFAYHK